MRKFAAYAVLLTSVLTVGCIENDIPYPVVECRIEGLSVEGLAGEPVIEFSGNDLRGSVTLPLLETTDIQNVEISEIRFTEGCESSRQLLGRHNLQEPLSFTLSLYQSYAWTITAEQTITREFTVEGQIGATEWNIAGRSAVVYVAAPEGDYDADHGPRSVLVRTLKLGPEGITKMSVPAQGIDDFDERDADEPWDFYTHREVQVEYHGRTEEWFLEVRYTDIKVAVERIDGWVRTAWLYGQGLSGAQLGFRYRPAGAEEWTTVDDEDIVVDGGSFSTRLRGLEPASEYEVMAWSGDDVSAVESFTTEPELPLPNSDFETWSTIGTLVCPYLSADDMFWDTGNNGAATVGAVLTESTPDKRPGSAGNLAASLTSKFAGFGGIGKFAAGNIFTGKYAGTNGTNGYVNFGRPFTSHPVALRGWVKFTNGKINRISGQPDGRTLTTDDVDEGQIYIALGTWTAAEYGGTDESPVQVYSGDKSTFFKSTAKDVIGYGEMIFRESVDGWTEFEIPITYKDTSIRPTHIIIVCAASRWGDYFTGSEQNRMWVDDFELVWE